MYTLETWSTFCFPNVHYRNVKYFLLFSCTLSQCEVVFVFLMYSIAIWSIFCFFQVDYRNKKCFLFFFCILSKREVFFLFFFRNTIENWSIFCFLMYSIKTWSSFCFAHVHYQNVKYFLFFSCTLFKREVVFGFFMDTI